MAIILMYDHLDFELLLLMRNSFYAFTNINVKKGGSCQGLQKWGGGCPGREMTEGQINFYLA